MSLSPETFDEVAELLMPRLKTEQERIKLLMRAFTGSPLRYNFNTSVAPAVFAGHLITQCADYPFDSERTALWVVLETVRDDVGVDKQARIDALRDAVNAVSAPAGRVAGQDPFAPHRADALFLLIGRNPLPNYVAAQHLIKPGGKIYLVHTKSTYDVAENLRQYIGRDRCELVGVPPLEPHVIYQKIADRVPKQAARIGLNYTGGTKIMSIQAYRALHSARTIYSYLNADTLQFVFEGNHAPVDAMANNLEVSFYELLEIHGWSRESSALQATPRNSDRVQQFDEALQTDADWLTDWALTCVPEGCRRARNLQLKELRTKLELDVAFMKGYQLIGLACEPTEDEATAKLKLLETADAARRLGGDEACFGLVSLLRRPDRLKRQLAHKWDRPERIKVFGKADLPDLADELRVWVEAMERERKRYG